MRQFNEKYFVLLWTDVATNYVYQVHLKRSQHKIFPPIGVFKLFFWTMKFFFEQNNLNNEMKSFNFYGKKCKQSSVECFGAQMRNMKLSCKVKFASKLPINKCKWIFMNTIETYKKKIWMNKIIWKKKKKNWTEKQAIHAIWRIFERKMTIETKPVDNIRSYNQQQEYNISFNMQCVQ